MLAASGARDGPAPSRPSQRRHGVTGCIPVSRVQSGHTHAGRARIDLPVLVANGDSDPMILPRYSYLLAGLLPNARLIIYPDSAHGFLFQHHTQFAADVNTFLA